MKVKYQLIAKRDQEWIVYEDKNYEKCLKEFKKFKTNYGDHIRFKIIKITEEVIKR